MSQKAHFGRLVDVGSFGLAIAACVGMAGPIVAATPLPTAVRAIVAASGGDAGTVQTTRRDAMDVRGLVRDRITAKLLDGAVALHGADYRFVAADGAVRHVDIVELRYATATIAAGRARPLLGPGRVLSGTKILTPMVVAALGSAVSVIFTESAGDQSLRAAMAQAAAGGARRMRP